MIRIFIAVDTFAGCCKILSNIKNSSIITTVQSIKPETEVINSSLISISLTIGDAVKQALRSAR